VNFIVLAMTLILSFPILASDLSLSRSEVKIQPLEIQFLENPQQMISCRHLHLRNERIKDLFANQVWYLKGIDFSFDENGLLFYRRAMDYYKEIWDLAHEQEWQPIAAKITAKFEELPIDNVPEAISILTSNQFSVVPINFIERSIGHWSYLNDVWQLEIPVSLADICFKESIDVSFLNQCPINENSNELCAQVEGCKIPKVTRWQDCKSKNTFSISLKDLEENLGKRSSVIRRRKNP